MRHGLTVGQQQRLQWQVLPEHAIHLTGGQADDPGVLVFSTPAMILLMELAAKRVLEPYLERGEQSVGMEVDVQHLAATPIGAAVHGEARISDVDGRQVQFEVAAYEGDQLIGRGRHRRAVVQLDRVRDQLKQKSTGLAGLPVTNSNSPAAMTVDLPPQNTIRVAIDGAVATVTLDRPEKLNAVNLQMTGELEQLTAYLAGHPDIRIVVLTGAGRAFCAGDDVAEVQTLSPPQAAALSHRQARLYLAWEQLPQVIIAAVNGPALGAGCVAAYSCDFRLAATNATFGMPEIMLGWPPGYGLAQLTAIVGKARALEMCLTARPVPARQALEWGLTHQVVPANQLLPTARQWSDSLLRTPPEALRQTKRLIHQDEGLQPKHAYLADTAAYIHCLQTPDAEEGMAAFLLKRTPKFSVR